MTAHAATDQIAEIIGLQTALDAKADDSAVVHKTGAAQAIDASTTFSLAVVATSGVKIGSNQLPIRQHATQPFAMEFPNASVFSNVIAFGPSYDGSIRVKVTGLGATAATSSLVIGNANGVPALVCLDSTQVLVGSSTAGSANAQREVRAGSASTPMDAGYDSSGVPRWLIGPKGRITTPGRDGPITANTDASTVTFDLGASDRHTLTLGGNRTLALANEPTGAQQFTLWITQDGTGSRTVTWWPGIKWSGGTAPTLTTTAGKTDVISFTRMSSGVYYGYVAGLNY